MGPRLRVKLPAVWFAGSHKSTDPPIAAAQQMCFSQMLGLLNGAFNRVWHIIGAPMSHSANGLYHPRYEHDSCGFGLIAQLDDHSSRLVVDGALQALAGLNHRGAVAADGRSGAGCGVLIRRPDAWMRAVAAEDGIADPPCISAEIGRASCRARVFQYA